eukprot:s1822_g10.t1
MVFLVVIHAQKVFQQSVAFPISFTMSANVVDLDATHASSGYDALMAKHMQPVVETSWARSSQGHGAQSAAFSIAKSLSRSDSEKTLKVGDPVPDPGPRMSLAFKPSAALEKFMPRALPVVPDPAPGFADKVPQGDVADNDPYCDGSGGSENHVARRLHYDFLEQDGPQDVFEDGMAASDSELVLSDDGESDSEDPPVKKARLIIKPGMSPSEIAEIEEKRAEKKRLGSRKWHGKFAAAGVSLFCHFSHAFAALLQNGTVVTWGHAASGGDSRRVAHRLKDVTHGTKTLYASEHAFAAIKHDGGAVTWGDSASGGDSFKVQDQLKTPGTRVAKGARWGGGRRLVSFRPLKLTVVSDVVVDPIDSSGLRDAVFTVSKKGDESGWQATPTTLPTSTRIVALTPTPFEDTAKLLTTKKANPKYRFYITAGNAGKAPPGASGSPVALHDAVATDQTPFLGTVVGHWGGAVIIGVPANGHKPSVVFEDVAKGGALSQALGVISAGVLHRAKPGYLSSLLSGSYFGPIGDEDTDARRVFEATAPNVASVAHQVNDLVDAIGSLSCGEDIQLTIEEADEEVIEPMLTSVGWLGRKTAAVFIAISLIAGYAWDPRPLDRRVAAIKDPFVSKLLGETLVESQTIEEWIQALRDGPLKREKHQKNKVTFTEDDGGLAVNKYLDYRLAISNLLSFNAGDVPVKPGIPIGILERLADMKSMTIGDVEVGLLSGKTVLSDKDLEELWAEMIVKTHEPPEMKCPCHESAVAVCGSCDSPLCEWCLGALNGPCHTCLKKFLIKASVGETLGPCQIVYVDGVRCLGFTEPSVFALVGVNYMYRGHLFMNGINAALATNVPDEDLSKYAEVQTVDWALEASGDFSSTVLKEMAEDWCKEPRMASWIAASKGVPLVFLGPFQNLGYRDGSGANELGNALATVRDGSRQVIPAIVRGPTPEVQEASDLPELENRSEVQTEGQGPSEVSVSLFASDYAPSCLEDLEKASTTEERQIAHYWIRKALGGERNSARRAMLISKFGLLESSARAAGDEMFLKWAEGMKPKPKPKQSGRGDATRARDEARQNVLHIEATHYSFAAVLADRSVVTWGDRRSGGDSRRVQHQLRNVWKIHATHFAFTAICGDGTVVTWGNPEYGGDSTDVRESFLCLP